MKNKYEEFLKESNFIDGEIETFSYGPIESPIIGYLPYGKLFPKDLETMEWWMSDDMWIDEGTIMELHDRLCEGRENIDKNSIGKYRLTYRKIGDHSGISAFHVPIEMRALIKNLETTNSFTALMLISTIQPFEDLNDMIARMVWRKLIDNEPEWDATRSFTSIFYDQMVLYFGRKADTPVR